MLGHDDSAGKFSGLSILAATIACFELLEREQSVLTVGSQGLLSSTEHLQAERQTRGQRPMPLVQAPRVL